MSEKHYPGAALRFREIGKIHSGIIAKKLSLSPSCLTLTKPEQVIVGDQIAALLMEVYKGATTLEPNEMQKSAAEAGREEITEADMLMFAVKVQMAEKLAGRQLTSQEQVKLIRAMPWGERTLTCEPKKDAK